MCSREIDAFVLEKAKSYHEGIPQNILLNEEFLLKKDVFVCLWIPRGIFFNCPQRKNNIKQAPFS